MSEFFGHSSPAAPVAPATDQIVTILHKLCQHRSATTEGSAEINNAIHTLRATCTELSEAELAEVFQRARADGLDFQQHPGVVAFYHGHLTELLAAAKINSYPPGHPARSYLEENQLLQGWLRAAEALELPRQEAEFTALLAKIATVDRHYIRKENQLFPLLEKHGWVNPSKFMWAFQDENRALLKATQAALSEADVAALRQHFERLAGELRRMIAVEETRLLPNAMELISDEEWQEMRRGDAEIGWMLSAPPPPYPAEPEAASPEPTASVISTGAPPADGARIRFNQPPRRRKDLPFPTDDKLYFGEGYLTPEQIDLLFRFLPVDLTYVDENDRVLFYNRGEDRVFSRSAGVIGREVRFCHPPKSVDTVLRIVAEFRAGSKDVADFWINMRGRMIHIRYFAVRDEQKRYRGVLEMTQDITEIRSLEGEQRLLDW